MGRREIIQQLGVTYAHKGDWQQPIVEMPGDSRKSPSPTIKMFGSEVEAAAHVRALARRSAERDIASAQALLSSPVVRFRLWLARNTMFFREREIGLIQTEAALSLRLKEARAIAAGAVPVTFVRLQDDVVCPPVLDPGLTVYLVDSRGHPSDAARLIETVITTRYVTSPRTGHDIGLRYALCGASVLFEVDEREDGQLVLSCADGDLVAYRDRELAQDLLDSLAMEVDAMPDAPDHDTQIPAQKRHVLRLLDQVGHLGGLDPSQWRRAPQQAVSSPN
ncbi:hypothetical protein [Bosea sp. RAC05]|uniref:hypothetical protein n=1 Tax=Bosea sp. RAC05 TaxID=1842539 RepID=UPI00083E26D1|nr:hypothetical protein [Bosea sp. RAC05]